METLNETIHREQTFLIACEGEQAERVRASLNFHIRMRDNG